MITSKGTTGQASYIITPSAGNFASDLSIIGSAESASVNGDMAKLIGNKQKPDLRGLAIY